MSVTIDTVRAAMTTDDRLDDLKRARIWNRIEDRLATPEPRRTWWPTALSFGGLAAAAAIALILLRARGAEDDRALTAPADTTLAARLGPHTHASIVGPARLEILGTPGDATSVNLRSGTLLAEFEGGAGRSLHIETSDASIDIVGTLFAVELRDGGTCVSVAHGKVRVTSAVGEIFVGGGEALCTRTGDAKHVHPIAPATRDALVRHSSMLAAADASATGANADVPTTSPTSAGSTTSASATAAITSPAPRAGGTAPAGIGAASSTSDPDGAVTSSSANAGAQTSVTSPSTNAAIASSAVTTPRTGGTPSATGPRAGTRSSTTDPNAIKSSSTNDGVRIGVMSSSATTAITSAAVATARTGGTASATGIRASSSSSTAAPHAAGTSSPARGGVEPEGVVPPSSSAAGATAAGAHAAMSPARGAAPAASTTSPPDAHAAVISPSSSAGGRESVTAASANASPGARTEVPAPALAPPPGAHAAVTASSAEPPAEARPATAEELYALVDAALARRDLAGADRALERIAITYPQTALLDQVLYERARIAYQRHAWGAARGHLDQLAGLSQTRLAEPGRYLACRIAVETRDEGAAQCLDSYRAKFPASPHDLDAASLLVQLAHTDGGCTTAAPRIAALVRAYPRSTQARTWRSRCPGAK